MIKKTFLTLFLTGGLVATSLAFSTFSTPQAPCKCCGEACICEVCVCDAGNCECSVGGTCVCDAVCCENCCVK